MEGREGSRQKVNTGESEDGLNINALTSCQGLGLAIADWREGFKGAVGFRGIKSGAWSAASV
jgi:hypothetical protein